MVLMLRRQFFASLFAPIIARFAPKVAVSSYAEANRLTYEPIRSGFLAFQKAQLELIASQANVPFERMVILEPGYRMLDPLLTPAPLHTEPPQRPDSQSTDS